MSSSHQDIRYNVLDSNNPRFITKLKEEKEKALRLYENGHTRKELYKETDLSMTEIRKLLKNHKPQKAVKTSPNIVNLMKKTILGYYNQGCTIETIINKTGYSQSRILAIIREHKKGGGIK